MELGSISIKYDKQYSYAFCCVICFDKLLELLKIQVLNISPAPITNATKYYPDY